MRNDAGESVGAKDAREGTDDLELVYDPAAVVK
jgi:hypothetical protein